MHVVLTCIDNFPIFINDPNGSPEHQFGTHLMTLDVPI